MIYYEETKRSGYDEYNFGSARGARLSAAQGVLATCAHQVDGSVSEALQRIDKIAGEVLGEASKGRIDLVQILEKGASVERTVREVVYRGATQRQRQLFG